MKKCTLIKAVLHGFATESDSEPSELLCAICKARGMGKCY